MNKSEDVKDLVAALVKFNLEVTKISKDAKNPFFKNNYATLDQIIDQVRPILASHGLVVMQDVSSDDDGRVTVKTSVMHESGQFIESSGTTLKLAKNDPQGAGAGITYGRRYDLSAVLSLNTGEDDDGNSASGNKPLPRPQKQPKQATASQRSEIENKAKEYVKLREKGTVQQVLEHLKIGDLKLIGANHATTSIKRLDLMIEKAKEK